jgi:hypothetical protein
MTVGRQHNERLNTRTNPKRRTETSGSHADILPDLRVIQYPYPLIEASRTIRHVTSLDDRSRHARVQSFPNTNDEIPTTGRQARERRVMSVGTAFKQTSRKPTGQPSTSPTFSARPPPPLFHHPSQAIVSSLSQPRIQRPSSKRARGVTRPGDGARRSSTSSCKSSAYYCKLSLNCPTTHTHITTSMPLVSSLMLHIIPSFSSFFQ